VGQGSDGAPAGPGVAQVLFLPDDAAAEGGVLAGATAPVAAVFLGRGAAASQVRPREIGRHEARLPVRGPCCLDQGVAGAQGAESGRQFAVDWPARSSRAREKVMPSAWLVGGTDARIAAGAPGGPKPLRASFRRGGWRLVGDRGWRVVVNGETRFGREGRVRERINAIARYRYVVVYAVAISLQRPCPWLLRPSPRGLPCICLRPLEVARLLPSLSVGPRSGCRRAIRR